MRHVDLDAARRHVESGAVGRHGGFGPHTREPAVEQDLPCGGRALTATTAGAGIPRERGSHVITIRALPSASRAMPTQASMMGLRRSARLDTEAWTRRRTPAWRAPRCRGAPSTPPARVRRRCGASRGFLRRGIGRPPAQVDSSAHSRSRGRGPGAPAPRPMPFASMARPPVCVASHWSIAVARSRSSGWPTSSAVQSRVERVGRRLDIGSTRGRRPGGRSAAARWQARRAEILR